MQDLTFRQMSLKMKRKEEVLGMRYEIKGDTLELALNMLAEATTTELTKVQNPQGLEENRIVAKTGGKIAGDARRRIEQETGTPVITSQNANNLSSIVTGMIEGVIEKEDK